MLRLRAREERGHTRIDWLESWHSFSFGDYQDPAHMGFGDLRVINDDTVKPGKGFGTHGHRDMEIVTYVLSGTLAHKDSMGNGSLIRPGDVQRMSAGTGILHSEFNPSDSDPVHFLQIWILPESQGREPGYEQKTFSREEKLGRLRLIGSRDDKDGSVRIGQDVQVHAAILPYSETISHQTSPGRQLWIHVATGAVQVNGKLLEAGDGAAILEPDQLELEGVNTESELLLFDLRQK